MTLFSGKKVRISVVGKSIAGFSPSLLKYLYLIPRIRKRSFDPRPIYKKQVIAFCISATNKLKHKKCKMPLLPIAYK